MKKLTLMFICVLLLFSSCSRNHTTESTNELCTSEYICESNSNITEIDQAEDYISFSDNHVNGTVGEIDINATIYFSYDFSEAKIYRCNRLWRDEIDCEELIPDGWSINYQDSYIEDSTGNRYAGVLEATYFNVYPDTRQNQCFFDSNLYLVGCEVVSSKYKILTSFDVVDGFNIYCDEYLQQIGLSPDIHVSHYDVSYDRNNPYTDMYIINPSIDGITIFSPNNSDRFYDYFGNDAGGFEPMTAVFYANNDGYYCERLFGEYLYNFEEVDSYSSIVYPDNFLYDVIPQIQQKLDDNHRNNPQIYAIDFGYLGLYETDGFSTTVFEDIWVSDDIYLIPVWRIHIVENSENNDSVIADWVYVNAIDGSFMQ